MVCYVIPAAAAALIYFQRKACGKTDVEGKQLGLLLAGGAIFGAVDHLWNNELFLIGKNITSDLLLGITITAAIYGVWLAIMVLNPVSARQAVANAGN